MTLPPTLPVLPQRDIASDASSARSVAVIRVCYRTFHVRNIWSASATSGTGTSRIVRDISILCLGKRVTADSGIEREVARIIGSRHPVRILPTRTVCRIIVNMGRLTADSNSYCSRSKRGEGDQPPLSLSRHAYCSSHGLGGPKSGPESAIALLYRSVDINTRLAPQRIAAMMYLSLMVPFTSPPLLHEEQA